MDEQTGVCHTLPSTKFYEQSRLSAFLIKFSSGLQAQKDPEVWIRSICMVYLAKESSVILQFLFAQILMHGKI